MQVQMNVIVQPSNVAPAHGAAPPVAGEASFSQLLQRATPRDAGQAAASPTSQREAGSAAVPPREAAPAAANADSSRVDAPAAETTPAGEAGRRVARADDNAAADSTQPHGAGAHASVEELQLAADTALAVAAAPDAIVVPAAATPPDASLATWLATFAATVVAASDLRHTTQDVEPDPSGAAPAPMRTTLPASALAIDAAASQRTQRDLQALPSAAEAASLVARDTARAPEAVAGSALTLRAARAGDTPALHADAHASLVTPLAMSAAVDHVAAPIATPGTSPVLTLLHAVGSHEFAPTLALTLTRLARDGVQEARLQLHPAEMGPIDVRIAVDGAQARVDFSVDVAATRSAIEAGLPTLASALRESGLTLAGGGVFQHAHQPHRHGAADHSTRGERSADEADVAAAPAAPQRVMRGVVDLYA